MKFGYMRKKGVYLVFLGIVFKSEMCCSYLNKSLGEIFPRVKTKEVGQKMSILV